MKARLPEQFQKKSQTELLRQARQMQDDVSALQDDLDAREYTATSGGDMVSATVNGEHRVLSLKISPELLKEEDPEMVEDLVAAAVNEAITTAVNTAAEEMDKVTGGLNIPGFPGLS